MNGIEPRGSAVPKRDAGGTPGDVVSGMLLNFPALIAAIDQDGVIRYWNNECERSLGYSRDEVVGAGGALERLAPSPGPRAELLSWWRSAEPRGTFEARLTDRRLEERVILWRRVPAAAQQGIPDSLAVGHDVTERDRTASQSRERLRTAFEHVPLDFWIMGSDGRYALVNPAARERWGDNTGRTLDEVPVPESVREHWRRVNEQAFAGETVRGEVEYAVGSGVRTYEYVVAPIRTGDGTVTQILGVNIDITERKRAEREHRRSETTKGAILDALPDLMFRMSAEGRYLDYHAPPHFALLAPPDRFVGCLVTDVLPRELAESCLRCISRTLSLGGVQRYEYAVPDNPSRHFEVRMTPCGSDEVVVLVRNISEIKLAEQSLRESESRYRALFDSSPLGLFVIQDGRMAMVNGAGLSLLGARAPSDVLGREAIQFVAERFRSDAAGCVAAALRDGRSPPHVEDLRRIDGSEVTVEAAGARIELGGRPAIQVISQDVTQRLRDQQALREADEQLRQSQKMEAVGQLAAGVAHDFNNLLTAIFGYVSLARSSLEPSNPAWTALDGVQAAAEQASGVIRSLLAVSRKAVALFTAIDLSRVVSEAIELLRAGFPSTITVRLDIPDGPVPVRGDPILLKQVVLNLAINARDAMARGGTLRVIVRGPDQSGLALFRVEDTGEGIPPEIQARVFEPFFTTKDRETSSGLGLSIAEGIVRSHGGSIEVESSPGRGTAFTVRLPGLSVSQAAPPPPARDAARVIVAEESRQIREVIGSALSRAGFTVSLASSPDGVSRVLSQSEPAVHAAIIDADTQSGAECLRRVSAAPGSIGIIAITASSEMTAQGSPSFLVLRKPFQVAQIPELVRQVLEHRGSAGPHPNDQESVP